MKYLLKALLIWTLILNAQLSRCQGLSSRDERASKKAYEEAGRYLRQKDYPSAIVQLKETVRHNPFFIKAHQQLGDCLRLTGAYEEARKSYTTVLRLDPSYSTLTIYSLAISEFYCGLYDSALAGFRKYQQTASTSANSGALVGKYINDCIFSIAALKNPRPFSPLNLGPGVNSSEQEYFPVATADSKRLIFTRRTEKNEDLYESVGGPDSWSTSIELGKAINTPGYNEGAQSISPDGNYLFYSACNKPGGRGSCDIYISHRTASGWSEPFNPGAPLNTGAWESQPSISANGQRLYFVSDRKGGFGANDIWYADLLAGGRWSEPVNAGQNINTPYDEHSPFIFPDNRTLYFSSNGWPGFGKQDLFVSRCDESGIWQKPENLGFPANSAEEQTGLSVSTDGLTAYYASDRPDGLGGMDIYSFRLTAEHRPSAVRVLEGVLRDAVKGERLDGQVMIEDFDSGTVLFEQDPSSGSNVLAVVPARDRYTLRVLKDGYMPYSENINAKDISTAEPFKMTVALKEIRAQEQGVLNNIFFETDQYTLLPASRTELNFLIRFLMDNPSIRIEIGGHTDSAGTNEWNITLSENRAKEVYKYLLANKINRDRLSYKGYGRTMPIADNATEIGKQVNRRTSFTILP